MEKGSAVIRGDHRGENRSMKTKRGICILLTVMMTFTLAVTALPRAAAAEEAPKAIVNGDGALIPWNKVYFGTDNNEPVLWRVLGTGNDGGGSSKLLLSEYLLGWIKFRVAYIYELNWLDSDAKTWCDNFYAGTGSAYNASEKFAVVPVTSKTDSAYQPYKDDSFPTRM